jgi:hypothetical protein
MVQYLESALSHSNYNWFVIMTIHEQVQYLEFDDSKRV